MLAVFSQNHWKMNESLIIMGVAAAMSFVIVGLLAYNIGTFITDTNFARASMLRDGSSLEEDFRDALAFLPLTEIRHIVESYAQYDPQIQETVTFINEQKKFIIMELEGIPQITMLANFLKENGLEVEYWAKTVVSLWNSMPPFVRAEPNIACGGLTGMISRILKAIPRNELHELLRQKYKYSTSFHRFVQALKSQSFNDLCAAIEKNSGLQRHFFWAKDANLEVVFVVEFMRNLYYYVTEQLA